MSNYRILEGDAAEQLATIEPETIQTCITSPPYWGLRDYGEDDQLGLEATPKEYTENLVAVFQEVKRVLKDDGTVWLNIGDSYAAARDSKSRPDSLREGEGTRVAKAANRNPANLKRAGLKHKDLVGIPWRIAFALQADGWYLRSDIIWHKPNPMPESVTDRPTKAHEYLFLLTKSARYYYDADAIREPHSLDDVGVAIPPVDTDEMGERFANPKGRNKRTVWTVTTKPFRGAHFAVFPPELIEPCVLAGSAEGDTVLDPFTGSGTTGMVALRQNRDFVGTELNPEYAEMARDRIREDAPLLNAEII